MDTEKNPQSQQPENPLMRPDHELPAPHDMLLEEGNDQQASDPPSPAQEAKKRSIPMWIFPAVAFLLVLLAGVFYFMNMQKQPESTPIPSAGTRAISPSPTPDPLAGWQKYQNAAELYTFMYPQNWFLEASPEGMVCIGSDQRFIDFYCNGETTIDPPTTGFKSTFVGLDTSVKIPRGTSESAALKLPAKRAETLPLIDESYITVNELPGYRAIRQASPAGILRTDVEYTILANDRLYRMWFEIDDDNPEDTIQVFDQVVNTFTILTPTPSVAVSSSPDNAAVVCTMDAKLCPDGSSVGRTGPNCEFAACPKQ